MVRNLRAISWVTGTEARVLWGGKADILKIGD